MKELSSFERIKMALEHKEPDRVPILDSPWGATVERWRREGLPENMDWRDFLGVDKAVGIGVDNSPRYEAVTLEETDDYKIVKSSWGATLKDFKHAATVPEFLDFAVTSREKWLEAKSRMTPALDRVDWAALRANYKRWRESGHWITAGFWFGFDVAHSWMVGTERFLMWLFEDPELCMDIFDTYLELDLAMFQKIWDEGYHFDAIRWPDDMGFKGKQFFSVGTYRELLKPFHKKAVDWAHAKGVKAELHSCGDVNPFIPELVEIGVDSLNPIEVKAGMDPLALKRDFGDKLALHGGTNALSWGDESVFAEIERIVPEMMRGGGYVFSSDHSIPSNVSLEQMRRIVALVKRKGQY